MIDKPERYFIVTWNQIDNEKNEINMGFSSFITTDGTCWDAKKIVDEIEKINGNGIAVQNVTEVTREIFILNEELQNQNAIRRGYKIKNFGEKVITH